MSRHSPDRWPIRRRSWVEWRQGQLQRDGAQFALSIPISSALPAPSEPEQALVGEDRREANDRTERS